MSFKEEIERINFLILNGQLDEAEKDLRVLTPFAIAERRTQAHYLAIIASERGDLTEAKIQLETALAKFGENVNLVRDLIVCQYRLQDMMGFRQGLSNLEFLLNEKREQLCARTLFECELVVGKFFEEEARLRPALEFYDRALQHASTPSQRLKRVLPRDDQRSPCAAHARFGDRTRAQFDFD